MRIILCVLLSFPAMASASGKLNLTPSKENVSPRLEKPIVQKETKFELLSLQVSIKSPPPNWNKISF